MTPKPHELAVKISNLPSWEASKAAAKEAGSDFFGKENAERFTYQFKGEESIPGRKKYSGVVFVYFDEYENNKEEQHDK